MLSIAEIVKKAAEKSGFQRVKYQEKDLPASMEDIVAMPLFGDMRSMFTASSLLLKRYREEVKGSKYFVLCSWPGYEHMFPYVNEYWSIKESIYKPFYYSCNEFENHSDFFITHKRELNYFFSDVVDFSVLTPYYSRGITQQFWERFMHVKRTLPVVPSSMVLGEAFNQELDKKSRFKVLIYPVLYVNSWKFDHNVWSFTSRDFWISLSKSLLSAGIIPVVYQNLLTHDLSSELTSECIYVNGNNIGNLIGVMRATGCVLDVFSGISRLSIAARCPFLACDIRSRYNQLKEYEIDDLCCEDNLPREYIFAFPTILGVGDSVWKENLFDMIIVKLNEFKRHLIRDNWPATSGTTEIVPYGKVKIRKVRRLGAKFIKVNKE